MEDKYYINLNNYSLSDYAKYLEHAELLPSRKIVQENTKERFACLQKNGIKNLNDVLTVLKTKDKVKAFAKKTGLPEEFLIHTLSVKPTGRIIFLNSFQWVS